MGNVELDAIFFVLLEWRHPYIIFINAQLGKFRDII